MSCNLKLYAPDEVDIYIGGVYKVNDLTEGTFVRISHDESVYKERVTSDGVVARTHRGNSLYRLTLSLNNTSDSNQVLTYLAHLDNVTQMGKFPIMIKDRNGDSLFFAHSAWISSKPNMSFSVELDAREWVISCSHPIFNLGGNDGESIAKDVVNMIAGATPIVNQIMGGL